MSAILQCVCARAPLPHSLNLAYRPWREGLLLFLKTNVSGGSDPGCSGSLGFLPGPVYSIHAWYLNYGPDSPASAEPEELAPN